MSLRTFRFVAVLSVCCLLVPVPTFADGPDSYQQQLLDAMAAVEAGAYTDADANARFASLSEDPRLEGLDLDVVVRTITTKAAIDAHSDPVAQLEELVERLETHGSDDPDDWYRMALASLHRGEFEIAARAMTTLAVRWPEVLPQLDPDALYPLIYQGDTGTAERTAFLQALFDADWDGGSPGMPDGAWLLLARAHLRQGDTGRAQQVAARITDAATLIALRSDLRNDVLLPTGDWRANIAYANAHAIDRARAFVARHPDRLEPISTLTQALLLGGYHEQVVAMVDEVLARIASAPIEAPPYADLHTQVWLMNYRSVALRRLGRIDEAAAQLQQASQLGERGTPNISQALNLGSFECDRGNSAAALAAAELAGEMGITPYGRAVHANILHCVAVQTGDTTGAEDALDTLTRLKDEAAVPYLEAILRGGLADAAAARLPELLASDPTRLHVLNWAQDCALPPPLPAQVDSRRAKANFLARPDVLEAINAVGRIESYDLYCQMLE